jgi:hypothetical protein
MNQEEIIRKFKHLPDDKIGDGVYIAYQWTDGKLTRLYIGTKQCGPMLQYDLYNPGDYGQGVDVTIADTVTTVLHGTHYDGDSQRYFLAGAWTNLYSRGNYGRNYAFGGNWSGHTKNLINPNWQRKDKTSELLTTGNDVITLPKGIKGNTQQIEMDCSGSWSIFYDSASEALNNRLSIDKIQHTMLPALTKNHLQKNETPNDIDNLLDVIEAYNL